MYATNDEITIIEDIMKTKADMELLAKKRAVLEAQLSPMLWYQKLDGTWVRYTKVDNLAELQAKGEVIRTSILHRYTSKIEPLKHPPKEMKGA